MSKELKFTLVRFQEFRTRFETVSHVLLILLIILNLKCYKSGWPVKSAKCLHGATGQHVQHMRKNWISNKVQNHYYSTGRERWKQLPDTQRIENVFRSRMPNSCELSVVELECLELLFGHKVRHERISNEKQVHRTTRSTRRQSVPIEFGILPLGELLQPQILFSCTVCVQISFSSLALVALKRSHSFFQNTLYTPFFFFFFI